MLTSVDLFTGIAGFVLALQDVATPIVYCDCETRFVRALMADGRILNAPIVEDVRDLDAIVAAVAGRSVDILTAGFPCVGFSVVGERRGLEDDRSGLFFATVRIIDAVRPRMALFENVASILSHRDDMRTVLMTLSSIGYSTRWTVCSAADVGAPQLRRRWFCLAMRKDAGPFPELCVREHVSPWSRRAPPLITRHRNGFAARYAALGNSVVPACARLAFLRLYSGFKADLQACVGYGDVSGPRRTAVPQHGFSDDGETMRSVRVARIVTTNGTRFVVDPGHHELPPGYVSRAGPKEVKDSFSRTSWPTPRASAAIPSRILTARSACDLSTLALFVSELNGTPLRRTAGNDCLDARFVEWLMGYPVDWTFVE